MNWTLIVQNQEWLHNLSGRNLIYETNDLGEGRTEAKRPRRKPENRKKLLPSWGIMGHQATRTHNQEYRAGDKTTPEALLK